MDTSPKEFYKRRRPNKFSDSKPVKKPSLPRPVLESHLITLTKRNEHDLFESFAISLCEVEICPNIKPNTGPAGGGDGKTDAESYPVSKTTALGWYVGHDTAAGNAQLAFAVSAKEAWEQKLKSDLKSIASTGRTFTHVYFITNQYVEASQRKTLEKDLSEKYSIDLHILDLNWIGDKVYNNNRIKLAITKLGIEVETPDIIEEGPIDVVRKKKIHDLDEKIQKAIESSNVNYSTVRNAIDAAVYSREQELPRHEVEGRLERAVRLSDEYGTKNQKFMSRYQKIWTAFWYFEDFQLVKSLYSDAQKHALAAGGIDNLEKLSNLRSNLFAIRQRNKSLIGKKFLEDKTKKLVDELQKIADDSRAPSSSLYAKTIIEEIKLTDNLQEGLKIDESLIALETIISQSEGYAGFPFEPVAQIITELGDVIDDNEHYDLLFNALTQATKKREGEKQSAIMTLSRAKSLLEKNQYYKTIQILGAALPDLHKEETMDEANEALYYMGKAYELVGLFWAARGSYINVASSETARFYREDEVSLTQLSSYGAMIDIELLLGRVSQVIQWYEVFLLFTRILNSDEWNLDEVTKDLLIKDLKIGSVILTASQTDEYFARLIGPLRKLGIDNAAIAGLYRIGRDDLFPTEFINGVPDKERDDYFKNWAQRVPRDITSNELIDYDKSKIYLKSSILGCEITVESDPSNLLVITAESILAATESLLATAMLHKGISIESRFDIRLEFVKETGSPELTYEILEDGSGIVVKVPDFNPHSIPVDDQGALFDSLVKIALHITASIVMFEDMEKSIEAILGSERGIVRSANFTLSYIRMANVIGVKPKYQIDDWTKDTQEPVPKPSEQVRPPLEKGIDQEEVNFKDLDKSQVSQRQMKNVSIIRNKLWDEAGWRGVMFGWVPQAGIPPFMALIFDNPAAAEKIFLNWRQEFGDQDVDHAIRISIMRDIDLESPYDYRMGISRNIDQFKGGSGLMANATRIHTMNAKTNTNLESFLKQYDEKKGYILTFAAFGSDGAPSVRHDLGILKTDLTIKSPADVGDNDFDSVLVGPSKK